MSDKGADLLARKWTREPLHVVLHENLHGRALDGTGALDRGVDSAANGHVSAEENFGMRNAECGMRARMSLSAISWLLHSAFHIRHSAFVKIVSGANRASSSCLRRRTRKVCKPGRAKCRGHSRSSAPQN